MGQKILYISIELIADIFRDGNEIHAKVSNGLPEDAELVRVIPDHGRNYEALPPRIGLVYSSASWPEQAPGAILEVLAPPVFTQMDECRKRLVKVPAGTTYVVDQREHIYGQ